MSEFRREEKDIADEIENYKKRAKSTHEKIWKKLKGFMLSANAFISLMCLGKHNNEKEIFRLKNLEYQFVRAVIFAESEKYVSEKKPSKEGIAHDYYAVIYCFEKFNLEQAIKKKRENSNYIIPSDTIIREEATKSARLGIHKEISNAAKSAYNKGGILECMTELAKLSRDTSLDFNSPFVKFLKRLIS